MLPFVFNWSVLEFTIGSVGIVRGICWLTARRAVQRRRRQDLSLFQGIDPQRAKDIHRIVKARGR